MNQKSGIAFIKDACRKKTLRRTLDKYLQLCHPTLQDEASPSGELKKLQKRGGSFPNLAGFCRFLHVGTEELLELSSEFPEEIDRLLTVLEDEALNSGLPPALLSVYLKKRLGYDRDAERTESEMSGLSVRFEHDILRDGE